MAIDLITLGVYWDRLISIGDEIIQALVHTSFSTNVRESYDLSCVVFDQPRPARSRRGSVQRALVHRYGAAADAGGDAASVSSAADVASPGDVVMTNDPWLGTGHLFDVNVMQPVFRAGAASWPTR
jgi:N-methylhydantoinase B